MSGQQGYQEVSKSRNKVYFREKSVGIVWQETASFGDHLENYGGIAQPGHDAEAKKRIEYWEKFHPVISWIMKDVVRKESQDQIFKVLNDLHSDFLKGVDLSWDLDKEDPRPHRKYWLQENRKSWYDIKHGEHVYIGVPISM